MPPLILLVALTFIALGIYNRTSRAVAPPVYDPLGYIQKGHSVWQLVGEGRLNGFLDAEPPLRPPGCVPFTQPFGYSADVHSFLFWSVFSPIAIWTMALWIGFGSRRRPIADRWSGLALCIGLLSLPLFYHFEANAEVDRVWVGQWGLQDTLLAALAALATSLVIRGAIGRNVALTTAGWVIAAYTLLVKPAGVLVMLTVLWIWIVEIAINPPHPDPVSPRGRWKYTLVSILSCGAAFVTITWCCLSSSYLSSANLRAAMTGQKILRSLHDTSPISLSVSFVRPVMGWFWPPALLGLIAKALTSTGVRSARGSLRRMRLRAGAAIPVMVGASVWWIFLAGMEARYVYPFILILLIWLLPDAVSRLNLRTWPSRAGLRVLCLSPTVVVVILLWSPHPSVPIQQLLGVNLSAGGYGRETTIAKHLMQIASARQRPLVIYSPDGYRAGVVQAVDVLAAVSSGRTVMLSWLRPLDWERKPGVRISEIIRADYILYEHSEGAISETITTVDSYDQELRAYNGWLATLSSDDGVDRESEGALVVLRIVDPDKLLKSFRRFADHVTWRDVFRENNPELFADAGR